MAALREFGQGLIDPKYCCCAIPLVNFGIYAVLSEQMVVGIAAGALAIATPRVVGTSFPGFATYIFAIVCFVIGALQPVGFIGVLREKTKTFRVYAWLNLLAILSAFITAAALIIVSATRHNTAVNSCISNFFTAPAQSTTSAASMLAQQGPLLCNAFAWADIGIMGGLWVLLLFVQGYFL